MAQTYFASIQPGLEEALLRDVRRFGGNRATIHHGGVEFDAARKTLYAAHLQSRTASRIWLRVDNFRACDAPELYQKTRRYGWERLIGGEHTIEIRAHSSKSRLYHTGKIRDAIADGLRDRFAEDLSGESPPTIVDSSEAPDDALCIMARLTDDRCQLNLDATGDLLHRRGWRTEIGEAPLRETIGAAILETIEWTPDQGLIDPMCGSGTIAIEAVLRATDRAPGLEREFAFQKWRNFQPERYQTISDDLRSQIQSALPAPVIGRDRNSEVVDVAGRNASRAGVAELVDFQVSDLNVDPLPHDTAWIVTNPPYGGRLDEGGSLNTLINAWQALDNQPPIAFLWPKAHGNQVTNLAGHELSQLTSFKNGGLSVDLWGNTPNT